MSRFSRLDSDEDRLPVGMRRIGYDADTRVYTFQDGDGGCWESAPGCEYGQLTRVGGGGVVVDDAAAAAADTEPFLEHGMGMGMGIGGQHRSWRADLMPFLNFGVIIGLSLLILFWYLHYAAGDEAALASLCSLRQMTYVIRQGDTCWSVGNVRGLSVDAILRANQGLECERLAVGSVICLPE